MLGSFAPTPQESSGPRVSTTPRNRVPSEMGRRDGIGERDGAASDVRQCRRSLQVSREADSWQMFGASPRSGLAHRS
jgi:hypothetical protein